MLVLLAAPAAAQDRLGLALGLQVGDPTGLALRVPGSGPVSWTGALAAHDGGAYVTVNRHREYPLTASPLHYYVAPGVHLGSARNDDLVLGANANLGLNFYQERFEIFLQVTPTLDLLPGLDLWLGAAVGARYAL